MIAAGLQLMLIGMGVVFVFLTILVMLMSLTGAIVRRIQPMTEGGGTAVSAPGSSGPVDSGVPIGVVLAAVGAHHQAHAAAKTPTGDNQ